MMYHSKTQTTTSVFKKLLRYVDFRTIWKYLLMYFVLILIVYPIDKVVIPVIVSNYVVTWNPGKNGVRTFGKTCLLLMSIIAFTWIIWTALYYLGLRLQQLISVNMKKTMIMNVLEDYKKHQKEKPLGRWITHMENIPTMFELVFYKLLVYIIPEITGILVVTCYFFYVDVRLGLLTVVFILLSVLFRWWPSCDMYA